MNPTFKTASGLILVILLLMVVSTPVCAFNNENNQQDPTSSENIWAVVEKQLTDTAADTALHFIQLLVRGSCGVDYKCQYDTYAYLLKNLELTFHLPAAIEVGEEMVSVAQNDNDLTAEASAHLNLYRFYDAMGYAEEATLQMEQAEQLFEQAGDHSSLIRIRADKLERSLKTGNRQAILLKMEALLNEAKALGDERNANNIHIRLIPQYFKDKQFEQVERHLNAVDQIPISSPIQQHEYKYLILSNLGWAELSKERSQYASAIEYFQKALQYCQMEPSRWLEISTLQKLAEVKMEMENYTEAEKYLQKAGEKAEALELHDLLAINYEMLSQIAEEQGRYSEALDFVKKKEFHEEAYSSRGSDFDLERHLLKKEAERLAAEKDASETALLEKGKQVHLATILIILSTLLLLILGVFFYRERKKANKIEAVKRPSHDTYPQKLSVPELEASMPGPSAELNAADQKWLKEFDAFILKKITDDTLSIPVLAQNFTMSESSLRRQVKRLVGMSPNKYIMEIRLQKGRELLETGQTNSISEVASAVGYGDSRSFARRFKEKYGQLPSDLIND